MKQHAFRKTAKQRPRLSAIASMQIDSPFQEDDISEEPVDFIPRQGYMAQQDFSTQQEEMQAYEEMRNYREMRRQQQSEAYEQISDHERHLAALHSAELLSAIGGADAFLPDLSISDPASLYTMQPMRNGWAQTSFQWLS
jgi:hypothetical protein